MAKAKTSTIDLPERRTLMDLFKTGQRVVIEDTTGGEGVPIWIETLSPVELTLCMEAGAAARAKMKALTAYQNEDERRAAFISRQEMDGMDFERESLLIFLSQTETQKQKLSHEAEIAAQDEWAKDDYLTGLISSWRSEMEKRWLIDNDDEEALRVHNELQRFANLVEEETEKDRQLFIKDHLEESTDSLKTKVVDVLISAEAEDAWFNEYRHQQVFYSTRTVEDHTVRYFDSREQLDKCNGKTLRLILDVLDELNVEPHEGKD